MKDLNVMEFDESVKQDTPLGLLRGIKFGTDTYDTLFMRLCRSVILVLRLYADVEWIGQYSYRASGW